VTRGDVGDNLGGGTSDGTCVGNQARERQHGLWELVMVSEFDSPRLMSEKPGMERKLF
jgi:hypothetical protein